MPPEDPASFAGERWSPKAVTAAACRPPAGTVAFTSEPLHRPPNCVHLACALAGCASRKLVVVWAEARHAADVWTFSSPCAESTLARLFGWRHGARRDVCPTAIFSFQRVSERVELPPVRLLPPPRDEAYAESKRQEGGAHVRVDGYPIPVRAPWLTLGLPWVPTRLACALPPRIQASVSLRLHLYTPDLRATPLPSARCRRMR